MANDAVETKIISMLDALQNGVVQVAGQAVKYAPDVMEAALAVTRVNALQSVVYGLVGLIVFSVCCFAIYKAAKLDTGDGNLLIPATVFGGIIGMISMVVFSIMLFDVWTWVGLFEPKLFIAHQIVQQVLR